MKSFIFPFGGCLVAVHSLSLSLFAITASETAKSVNSQRGLTSTPPCLCARLTYSRRSALGRSVPFGYIPTFRPCSVSTGWQLVSVASAPAGNIITKRKGEKDHLNSELGTSSELRVKYCGYKLPLLKAFLVTSFIGGATHWCVCLPLWVMLPRLWRSTINKFNQSFFCIVLFVCSSLYTVFVKSNASCF